MKEIGNSGVMASTVIMGMWQAGKQYWVGVDDKDIENAIEAALDHGINAFDTAEAYGNGYSERILGRVLRDKRERSVIMTKVFSNHLNYQQIIEACHQSLRNLKTDYIDLYQIHWPSGCWGSAVVPIGESMNALIELKQQGKIRAIGVSNFTLAELKAACDCGEIVSLQPPYSLFWRHIELKLKPWCQKHGLSVLAYSPLAQGILSGKFGKSHRFQAGDHRQDNHLFQSQHWPLVLSCIDRLGSIANDRDVSLSQLALAWLTNQSGTFAIAGVRNEQQISENAKAMHITLSEDECRELDAIAEPLFTRFIDQPVPWTWSTR